jgi:hypothetical protein
VNERAGQTAHRFSAYGKKKVKMCVREEENNNERARVNNMGGKKGGSSARRRGVTVTPQRSPRSDLRPLWMRADQRHAVIVLAWARMSEAHRPTHFTLHVNVNRKPHVEKK